jgi:hypothetical protein
MNDTKKNIEDVGQCWKHIYLFIYLLTTKGFQEEKLGEAKDIKKCQEHVQGTLNNIFKKLNDL